MKKFISLVGVMGLLGACGGLLYPVAGRKPDMI